MTSSSACSCIRQRRSRRQTGTTTRDLAVVVALAAPLVVLLSPSSTFFVAAAASAIGTSRDIFTDADAADLEGTASERSNSYNNRHTTNNDADATNKQRATFRVFQALPTEPNLMIPDELVEMHRTIRATQAMVFAPSLQHYQTVADASSSFQQGQRQGITRSLQDDELEFALDIYTPSERREYLVQRGSHCHPRSNSGVAGSGSSAGASAGVSGNAALNALMNDQEDEDTSSLQWYDVLSRYDSLMAASAKSLSSVNAGDKIRDYSKSSKDFTSATKNNKASAANSAELERMAIELFKYCVLYNGDGHAFWGWEEQLLVPFRDVVNVDVNFGVVAHMDGGVNGQMQQQKADKLDSSGAGAGAGAGDGNTGSTPGRYIHESFLSISPYTPATSELSAMIRLLLETPDDTLALNPLLLSRELHRLILARAEGGNAGKGSNSKTTLSGGVDANDEDGDGGEGVGSEKREGNNGATWTLLSNSCIPLADLARSNSNAASAESGLDSFFADTLSSSSTSGLGMSNTPDTYARRMAARCPLSEGGYCCLTFLPDKSTSDGGSRRSSRKVLPVMALRHPVGGWTSGKASSGQHATATDQLMPYKLDLEQQTRKKDSSKSSSSSSKPLKLGGVPEADLPYISTVRLVKNNTESYPTTSIGSEQVVTNFPTHPADSPNFFDILFENDCLPYRKECHRCLKDVANEAPLATSDDNNEGSEEGINKLITHTTNACSKCQLECPCYCDILCKIRPPPKPITRTYSVRTPRYRKEPDRLVPKIIHQTWFEPVTKDKYPNMSRLIESWKKSGWEYYFYDDDTAAEFLGSHFPPEVREAYESITPGAFKADLFRYCVLLIRGGVYADMDVLLETNLDDAVANDVGFMTPIDEPGIDVGHRSCLWNGLIASAPGHPFLARTIEIVVNNIRNRFTAVDYDDMLCPNPILSVSHTVDTLFTCGPCILGAGINNLMGRHMQTEFEIGDVDIWQKERSQQHLKGSNASNLAANIRPDDPRLLIPGRAVILEQNKNDMGAHRFTWADHHLIVAATDMPDYDDRPPSKEHYSKTHEKAGVYGMRKLYTNTKRANEEIRIVVEKLYL